MPQVIRSWAMEAALALFATLALALGALLGALGGAIAHGIGSSGGWGAFRSGGAILLGVTLFGALGAGLASSSKMPNPALAGAALGTLALVGAILVPHGPGALPVGLARAAALVLLGALLDGAASGWGVFAGAGGATPPWSPEVSARLLDLSPRAFVMELGGFDWMRHPSIYDPVGTDRISPTLRSAWGGILALLMPLVVGLCGLSFRMLVRGAPQTTDPWPRSPSAL